MSNNLDMSPVSSKIALSVLTIEITRRCNIRPICPHCLRGDPQNIDLSTHVIDNLLEQTDEIGNLCITGGEPLVSLPSLEYLFQKIRLNRVKLSYFSLITNGLICPDSFVELILNIDDYIYNQPHRNKEKPTVAVCVSQDQYHNNNEGSEFIQKCRDSFRGKNIIVMPHIYGMTPIRTGKAESLGLLETDTYKPEFNATSAIDYMEPGHDVPSCLSLRNKERVLEKYKNMPVVFCDLYLSSKGVLYAANAVKDCPYSYIDSSRSICDLKAGANILDSIKMYNRGRKTCRECKLEAIESKTLHDLFSEGINEFTTKNYMIQSPVLGYSETDRLLAKQDMDEILRIKSEFDCTLGNAFMMWMDKIQEEGQPLNDTRTPYQKLRNGILKRMYSYMP